jgi:nickel-dependent lactate racemase
MGKIVERKLKYRYPTNNLAAEVKIRSELAFPLEGKIAVIIEDATRPHSFVVNIVLNMIRKLRGDTIEVRVVVASGGHKQPTIDEVSSWMGPRNHFPIYFHCSVLGDSYFLGDDHYRIGIGTVTPHTHVEYSGGAKLICPGLMDLDNIRKFHKMDRDNAESILRWYEAKLDQVVNFTVNTNGDPVDIEVGDPVTVRKNIMRNVRKTYGYKFREEDLNADIVILEPLIKTYDMFQIMNVLNIFDQNPHILKPGGTLCIKADFPNGIGDHSIFGNIKYDVDTRWAKILSDKHIQFITDGPVSYPDINQFFDKDIYKITTKSFLHYLGISKGLKSVEYTGADIMIGV